MTPLYKTAEGERLVREHYLAFLKYWPAPNEHVRIATSQGETFVVACGDVTAPPLLLLHGSAGGAGGSNTAGVRVSLPHQTSLAVPASFV